VVVGRELDAFNLSMMEWLLLATVGNGPIEGMTMSEVATRLDVTLPQVTALMNDLVKQKYLKQKVSTSDRRSRRLVCTPEGKRLIAKTEEVTSKAVRKWMKSIPDDQLEAYLSTITDLADKKTH
jgi:DNA-binding MarR family transcriptional regulator